MGRTFYTSNMFSLKLVLSVCIIYFIVTEAAPKPKPEPKPEPKPQFGGYPPYYFPFYGAPGGRGAEWGRGCGPWTRNCRAQTLQLAFPTLLFNRRMQKIFGERHSYN